MIFIVSSSIKNFGSSLCESSSPPVPDSIRLQHPGDKLRVVRVKDECHDILVQVPLTDTSLRDGKEALSTGTSDLQKAIFVAGHVG